jgi:hypothetical protein
MIRQVFLIVLASAAICSVAQCASAEIVLDEFTETATGKIVEAFRNEFTETSNVPQLNADRQIRIATGGTDVVGSFDINVTSPGQMDVKLQRITSTVPDLPLSAVQFNYIFPPTDVTEEGKNDAILFDFVELESDIQPTFLRAIVRDDTNLRSSFEIRLFPLQANNQPFTLAARFDAFTVRGGAPGLPDMTTLKEIYFDFFFAGHQGELNWSARLERIRFGAVVPEPSSIALLFAGLGAVCARMV